MNKTGTAWWLTGAVVLLLIGGCTPPQGVRPSPPLIPAPGLDQSHPQATLVLGSEGLVGRIALLDPVVRRVGQLAQARVTVQNLTDLRHVLEYRFEWQDDQGFAVTDPGVWRRFTLAPHQVESFTSTGKTVEASRIRFTVRIPDDVFINMPRDGESH